MHTHVRDHFHTRYLRFFVIQGSLSILLLGQDGLAIRQKHIHPFGQHVIVERVGGLTFTSEGLGSSCVRVVLRAAAPGDSLGSARET